MNFDDIAMHWEKAETLFSGSLVLVWLHIDQIVGPSWDAGGRGKSARVVFHG